MKEHYPKIERILTPEELALLKKKELVIMDEIHRICTKHGIQYSLFYGSMLGAARHHGFIPWDDDMDVVMLRHEYARFEEACKIELGDLFFLQTNETDPFWHHPFLKKMRLNGTELVECATRKSSMHQGIWVDIFVLDYADDSLSDYKREKWYVRLWKDKYRFSYSFFKSNIKGKAYLLFRFLSWPFTKSFTAVMAEKYRRKAIFHSTSKELLYDANTVKIGKLYPRVWLGDVCLCKFEDREYFCFKAYKDCLKMIYGDYLVLPPEKQRRPNHGYCYVNLGERL